MADVHAMYPEFQVSVVTADTTYGCAFTISCIIISSICVGYAVAIAIAITFAAFTGRAAATCCSHSTAAATEANAAAATAIATTAIATTAIATTAAAGTAIATSTAASHHGHAAISIAPECTAATPTSAATTAATSRCTATAISPTASHSVRGPSAAAWATPARDARSAQWHVHVEGEAAAGGAC